MEGPVPSPTLVFDGACGLCRNSVGFLRARLGDGDLVFRPCQEVGGVLSALGEDPEACMREALLLVPDRAGGVRVLRGAAAVNGALRRLRGRRAWPWRLAGGLYRVPGVGFLERRTYRWVARNRHRHVLRWLGRARP